MAPRPAPPLKHRDDLSNGSNASQWLQLLPSPLRRRVERREGACRDNVSTPIPEGEVCLEYTNSAVKKKERIRASRIDAYSRVVFQSRSAKQKCRGMLYFKTIEAQRTKLLQERLSRAALRFCIKPVVSTGVLRSLENTRPLGPP